MLDIQRESAYADLKNTTTYPLVSPTTNEKIMMITTFYVKGLADTGPLCCQHGRAAFEARSPNDLLASARMEGVLIFPHSIQWLSLAGIHRDIKGLQSS